MSSTGKADVPSGSPVIVQPQGGRTLDAFGVSMHMMLGGPETGGLFAVALETTPPGGGPPPHRHRNDDELFLVLDGDEEFLAEGRWTRVGQAGRFDVFFNRAAEAFAAPGGPDMAAVAAAVAEYGVEFMQPSAPPA
jgi:hypothetical protein